MLGASHDRGRGRAPAVAAFCLASALLLAPTAASAQPPDPTGAPPPPPPATTGFQAPAAGFQAPTAPPVVVVEKPSLIKELPIAAYVTTGATAIVGAVLNVFGANAANDLKDPSKHTTPDETHSLVVKARAGEVVSGVMFGFTGAAAVWGTISTVRAVMKISAIVKQQLPPVTVSVAPLPGGVGIAIGGRF